MLPKISRLSLKNEWPKMKREGKRFAGPLFNLLVWGQPLTANVQSPTQFAFVVSTKISKKAVVRNRVKRLLREAVHSSLPQVRPDLAVLVFGKKDLVGKNLDQIQKEMEKLLQKAQVLP